MKKLIYLFVAAIIFVFTACGGGEAATEEVVVETTVCADDCQKACCLGCKATEGDAKCIVLEDGSMPCCIAKKEATCCCGDANCDSSCHVDAEEAHNHTDDNHGHEH
jgi:hypothetical protein